MINVFWLYGLLEILPSVLCQPVPLPQVFLEVTDRRNQLAFEQAIWEIYFKSVVAACKFFYSVTLLKQELLFKFFVSIPIFIFYIKTAWNLFDMLDQLHSIFWTQYIFYWTSHSFLTLIQNEIQRSDYEKLFVLSEAGAWAEIDPKHLSF